MNEFLHHAWDAAPLIMMLIMMEGLLSVDNVLAIASLASELPEAQRRVALRLGLLGAYVFRGLALLFATVVAHNHTLMVLGAAYLIHLAASHFADLAAETDDDPSTVAGPHRTFFQTVVAIQFLDLSLSLDNVVVAVGVAPGQPWIVYTGVALGLITLWLFATVSLKLIEKFPILQHAAFVLVGFIGVMLLIECLTDVSVSKLQKFAGSASIITLCLVYEKSPGLRNFLKPVFAFLIIPLRGYEMVIRKTSAALKALFGMLGAAFRRKA